MPDLLKKWFAANGEMPSELIDKLTTPGLGLPSTQVLLDLGWTGNLIATVGLELSADNRRIQRSHFMLLGPLTRNPINIQASKLFPAADPSITLTITMPDSGEFRFRGGTLSSDILPAEGYKHHYSKAGNIIFPTDWLLNNIGETCMRAVSHLDKTSNTVSGPRPKTTILLFPKSLEGMNQASDSTQHVAWPGLRILQATGEFFPKVGPWKDPICPIFLRGSPREDAPHFPTGKDIRFNVAAIMRTARVPTACTTARGLDRQWRKATEDIESLEREPAITWPDIPRPQAPEGRKLSHN